MSGSYLARGKTEPLVSGTKHTDGRPDKDWRMACTYLADIAPEQFSIQNPPTFAQHIEAKFAMRMWRERITDAEIVIERSPCGADTPPDDRTRNLTCHRWLAKMLPPGARLRVTDRDGRSVDYHRPRRSDR